jgi:hypothetical protein
MHPLPSGEIHDKRARTSSSGGLRQGAVGAGTSISSGGTSSSGETAIAGSYGTGTFSSSSRTTVVLRRDSETSSSTTYMCFALGTSSSLYITCVTNWSGETGSSWRRRLILHTEPCLGFRSGAGGWWAGMNE